MSAKRLAAAIEDWLLKEYTRRVGDLASGAVPVEAYKERIAEIRAIREVREALPGILKELDER